MHEKEISSREAPALDTHAAASYLGMRPTTLRSWRRRGRGPTFVKLDSGTVRYRLTELEKYATTDGRQSKGGE